MIKEPQLQGNPIVRLNDIQKTLVKDTEISEKINGLTSSQATETIIIPQW